MVDSFDSRHGQLAVFHFYQANVADAQTNVDLSLAAIAGQNNKVTMPHSGSVVGVSAITNAAVTAGTITITPHENGTEFADASVPQAVLDTTNTTSHYATARPGAVTFDAGSVLGLSVTTASLTPETLEMDAWLFVVLDPN